MMIDLYFHKIKVSCLSFENKIILQMFYLFWPCLRVGGFFCNPGLLPENSNVNSHIRQITGTPENTSSKFNMFQGLCVADSRRVHNTIAENISNIIHNTV